MIGNPRVGNHRPLGVRTRWAFVGRVAALAVVLGLVSGVAVFLRPGFAEVDDSEGGSSARGVWMKADSFERTDRKNHGKALLDGEACDTSKPPDWCGNVLVAGGITNYFSTASAEIYDPDAPNPTGVGRWRLTETTSRVGAKQLVGLDDGRVLDPGTVSTGLTLGGEVFDPRDETWEEVGVPKTKFPGVLVKLADGRVLDFGGDSGHGDRAELFEPEVGENGVWRVTTPPRRFRGEAATGTLLTADACKGSGPPEWCGKVLVVGGNTKKFGSSMLRNPKGVVELYDPEAETWEETGKLESGPRDAHTASLLTGESCSGNEEDPEWCASGEAEVAVLVTGGEVERAREPGDLFVSQTAGELHEAAEVYDPETGEWNETGPMVMPRTGHVATRLGDGRVLVAGGEAEEELEDRQDEIYDPQTGEFSPAGQGRPGAQSAVTLDDGRALVSNLDESVLYDPIAKKETQLHPEPSIQTIQPSVGLLDGGEDVWIFGENLSPLEGVSFDGDQAPVMQEGPRLLRVENPEHDSAEPVSVKVRTSGGSATEEFRYVRRSGVWSDADAMSEARKPPKAAKLEGALCEGASPPEWCGQALVVSDGRAELYDPQSGSWRAAAELPEGVQGRSATSLADGRVLLVDGSMGFVYHPGDDRWEQTGPLAVRRIKHSATRLEDGRVLVAGGGGSEKMSEEARKTAEIYDPATNEWSVAAPMEYARQDHAAVRLENGRVAAIAGTAGEVTSFGETNAHNHVEIYDPEADRWEEAADAGKVRWNHTATRLEDGSVLVAGGQDHSLAPRAEVERFYPNGDGPCAEPWCPQDSMPRARYEHGQVLMPDGTVLMVGGGTTRLNEEGYRISYAQVDVYDPDAPVGHQWRPTEPLATPRQSSAVTLLDQRECGQRCGTVLAAGGENAADPLKSAEVYTPRPQITRVDPARGSLEGGTEVTVEGFGLAGDVSVTFGGVGAEEVEAEGTSGRRLTAVTPPAEQPGPVQVSVTVDPADGGEPLTSLETGEFVYAGAPARVQDLAGEALSPSEVELSWSAVDDGSGEPAGAYEVVHAGEPIDSEADFEAADALCGGVCDDFVVNDVGEELTLEVAGLPPDATTHLAVRAVNDVGEAGPVSDSVALTTPPLPEGTPGQVTDLAAEAVSPSEIELSWSAVDDGSSAPASEYVVVQSPEPITSDADFEAARTLCDPCRFEPAAIGEALALTVTDLSPGTTYHYALKAVTEGGEIGPQSNTAQATTPHAVGAAAGDDAPAAEPVEAAARLSGAGRIQTAVAISQRQFPGGAERAYLARADVFADAVVGGTVPDGPILLTPGDGEVHPDVAAEIERLDPAEVVALGGTQAISDATLASAASGRATDRYAGEDRVRTAAAISEHVFPDGADEVYLARADVFADAVVGGSLPGGPILLVPREGAVPATVREEIDRVDPDRVLALGGTAAVSDGVLADAAAGRETARLAGSGRIETAAEIARYAYPDQAGDVFLARGDVFADAVAGGTLTAGPTLLTPSEGELPAVVAREISRLEPPQVTALGGSAAVSDALLRKAAEQR